MDYHYSKMLKWFFENRPDQLHRFIESVSVNQQESKRALVDIVRKRSIVRDVGSGKIRIEIVGGWFGWPLIQMLDKAFPNKIEYVRVYDLDVFACRVVDRYTEYYNPSFKVTSFNEDYFSDTAQRRCQLLINTSCEHMPCMSTVKTHYRRPHDVLIALQSNNMTWEPDHTNCVESVEQLVDQGDLVDWVTESTPLTAKDKPYTRFTVVGRWQ